MIINNARGYIALTDHSSRYNNVYNDVVLHAYTGM